MNWKEQFDKEFSNHAFHPDSKEQFLSFISTEMEKLIHDAVAKTAIMGTDKAREALIKKWL